MLWLRWYGALPRTAGGVLLFEFVPERSLWLEAVSAPPLGVPAGWVNRAPLGDEPEPSGRVQNVGPFPLCCLGAAAARVGRVIFPQLGTYSKQGKVS